MPLVRAIAQPTSSELDLELTVGLPPSMNGTWFGFIRPGAMLTSTQYRIHQVNGSDGTNLPAVGLSRNTSNNLLWVGGANLTGPAFTSASKAIAVVLVVDGSTGTFFWRFLNTGTWSSATSATFLTGGPFRMTSVNLFHAAVGVSFIGAQWGWRYWPAGANPTTPAELDIEFASLYPVRRGATIIWPLQGATAAAFLDESGNGRHLVKLTTNAPVEATGSELATRSYQPWHDMKSATSEALWSASQRTMRNPLLGL